MSRLGLPFEERYCPSIAKFSNGEKRKQESEKALKDPQAYWSEKAKAIDWLKPFSKVLTIQTRRSSNGSQMGN